MFFACCRSFMKEASVKWAQKLNARRREHTEAKPKQARAKAAKSVAEAAETRAAVVATVVAEAEAVAVREAVEEGSLFLRRTTSRLPSC